MLKLPELEVHLRNTLKECSIHVPEDVWHTDIAQMGVSSLILILVLTVMEDKFGIQPVDLSLIEQPYTFFKLLFKVDSDCSRSTC